MVSDTTKHYPVLLEEIISIISPQHGGTFIDCTFGQGGYTKKILSYKKTNVIGLDRDIKSKNYADAIYNQFQERFLFKNKKFSQINDLKLKNENIRGVIFDLGYSLIQIKDKSKGLSFNHSGDLNMKLGLNDFSAKETINKLNRDQLGKIFRFFGEEKEAKKIANLIVAERLKKEINTETLVQLIEKIKEKKILKFIVQLKFFKL